MPRSGYMLEIGWRYWILGFAVVDFYGGSFSLCDHAGWLAQLWKERCLWQVVIARSGSTTSFMNQSCGSQVSVVEMSRPCDKGPAMGEMKKRKSRC